MAIYKLYIRTIGWGSWWIFIVLCSGFVVALTLSRENALALPSACAGVDLLTACLEEIWLKFWTEANARNPHDRLGYYLSLFAVWSVLAITFFLGACLYVLKLSTLCVT
jgi:hypothetical protein